MKIARLRRPLAIATALTATVALVACSSDDSGDAPSLEGNEDLFTSSGFQEAVTAVADEDGADAPVLRTQITSGGAEFQLRDGEAATGYVYTGGELQPVDVEIIGTGSLEGQDFPLSDVDPAAIDKIRTGVAEESGIDDIEITVMTLEKQVTDGELRWVINAEGGGRTGLVYNADPDGSNITSPTGSIPSADSGSGDTGGGGDSADAGGGGGSADTGGGGDSADAGGGGGTVPDVQAIAECIQEAAGDVEAIQACTQ